MVQKVNIGIIICNRYGTCAGGKCFRSMRNYEGAFEQYQGQELVLVGYTNCGGCPGGNVEYAGNEMIKNGVEVIHFATGLLVGYPPCQNIDTFKKFLEKRYGVKVVLGTHPIPQSYYDMHTYLDTWRSPVWQERIKDVLTDEETRLAYN